MQVAARQTAPIRVGCHVLSFCGHQQLSILNYYLWKAIIACTKCGNLVHAVPYDFDGSNYDSFLQPVLRTCD